MLIHKMRPVDYDDVIALLRANAPQGAAADRDGGSADRRWILDHSTMSLVARENDKLVGAILCDHDGHRGVMHRLAVAESHQNSGLAMMLVDRALGKLRTQGVRRCHLRLPPSVQGKPFWESVRWVCRQSDPAQFGQDEQVTPVGGNSNPESAGSPSA